MFEYIARVVKVVDGDTIDVVIDLGFRMSTVQRIRLYGLDTPERGMAGASEAKEMLTTLISEPGLVARTIKPADKYGRWLASLHTATCPNVAEAIIAAGLARPYFGGTKE